MRHIKILGITGGVGAGKSTILSYLEHKYQVCVIQLDQVAHMLMLPGKKCYEQILAVFGENILAADGSIDRKKLGNITFSDQEKLQVLNEILHPAVKEYVKKRIREESEGESGFLVIEAALLFEDHYDEICDEIWYIYVNEENREKRLMASRGYTKEKISEILANQKTDAEFRRASQFIIDNNSKIIENTYEQIDRGLKKHGFL